MHETTKSSKQRSYGWVVVVIFVLIILIFGGESSKLRCEHVKRTSSVNCLKQSKLLWFIPLGTSSIHDVRGAVVTETTDNEGDTMYRVELLTTHGNYPLTSMYTSGSSTKHDVSNAINTYVNSAHDTPLEVIEPGMLSGENLICMAIWLPISWAVNTLWKSFKSRGQ